RGCALRKAALGWPGPLLLLGRASSALLRLASKTANGSLLFTECVLGVRPPLATTQADIGWRSERRAIFAPDPLALAAPAKSLLPGVASRGRAGPCWQPIRQGSVPYPIKFGWQVGTPPRISRRIPAALPH